MKGLSNKVNMPGFTADLTYEWKRYYRNIWKVSESNSNLTPAQFSSTFDYNCYNNCTETSSPTVYCQGIYHEYYDLGHPELFTDWMACEDIKEQKCRDICSTQSGANTSPRPPQPGFHP